MPIIILNGKVTPNDALNDNVGFASGTEIRMAAGTAIYDALANKVAIIADPPTESPSTVAVMAPTMPKHIGVNMPNPTKNTP